MSLPCPPPTKLSKMPDLFHEAGLGEAFFPALFEEGDAQLAMDRSIGEIFGGQPLDTSTDISSVLRGLLASTWVGLMESEVRWVDGKI